MTEDEMYKEIPALICRVLDLERDCERLTSERDRLAKHVRETDRIFLQACRDRDEARREVCRMAAGSNGNAQDEAERRGWPSCFDVFDTRGLHGDPKEPRPVPQVLKQGSWVDEGSHA